MTMRRTSLALFLLGALIATPGQAGTIVTLRSGNGPINNLDGSRSDSLVHVLTAVDSYNTGTGTDFDHTFTAGDFAAARSGPNAFIFDYPYASLLTSDPAARYIGTTDNTDTTGSGLYAIDFTLASLPADASLSLTYNIDNYLGDKEFVGPSGLNDGVFLNGTSLGTPPGVGPSVGELVYNVPNIGSLLHVGVNTLYLYEYNVGGPGSLIFSATISNNAAPLATPEPSTIASATIGGLGLAVLARRRRRARADA